MSIKSKTSLKKTICIGIIIIIVFTLAFSIIIKKQYKNYTRIINENISKIISKVIEKYPEVKEEELIEIINEDEPVKEDILQKYGYDDEIANINEMKKIIESNTIGNIAFVIIFGISCISIYIIYVLNQERKIKEINDYIKNINNGDYTLKIEDNGEGELSRLRNELYKTTILLRESAENSEKEKKQLSNSLADISHQIKTPLTSIGILLDNIKDNPDMESKIREDFIQEISKQTDWITSLVISLLKLAKFDAGAIKMENEEINAKELINNVIKNISILIEIKQIEVIVDVEDDASFIADYKWQLEALTNILKNAVEHSYENSKIYINVENTSVFLKIRIKDKGNGIDREDLKHIFKRFYKSKNSKEENVGIGLPLAKTIIEQNNGYIKVDSKPNIGTTFEIKYIK